MAGDFLIWNFPNAGNPQKVQRYPDRVGRCPAGDGRSLDPSCWCPRTACRSAVVERIADVLHTIADTLDRLVDDVVAMMNADATLDEIVHTVRVAPDVLAKPFMRPLYDEPEFVVHNVWRQFGGWWDGAPSRLKPAPDAVVAATMAELAGGPAALIARAVVAAEAGDFRLAGHLADYAGWAAPDDPGDPPRAGCCVPCPPRRGAVADGKGIFAAAARESEAIAARSDAPER